MIGGKREGEGGREREKGRKGRRGRRIEKERGVDLVSQTLWRLRIFLRRNALEVDVVREDRCLSRGKELKLLVVVFMALHHPLVKRVRLICVLGDSE
jgi:hypothetical protein